MGIKFKNNAATTIVTATLNPSDTSVQVSSSALFPAAGAGDYFYATLSDAATGNTIEIIKVTAVSGSTWTIARAQDGTSANTYISGDNVQLRLVAAILDNTPKLDEANVYTGINTFSQTLISTGLTQTTNSLLGRSTASSGAVEEISIGSGLTLAGGLITTSGDITASGFTQNTSSLLGRTTAAHGSIEEISVGSGLTLSAGSLSVTSSSFPSGTRMAFQQTAAPTGWTKDTTGALNDSIMRIVTGTVASGGSTAFSTWAGQSSSGATTLSSSQIPAHTHNVGVISGTALGTGINANSGSGTVKTTNFTSTSTGGGSSHTHSLSQNIKYYDFIVAQKD